MHSYSMIMHSVQSYLYDHIVNHNHKKPISPSVRFSTYRWPTWNSSLLKHYNPTACLTSSEHENSSSKLFRIFERSKTKNSKMKSIKLFQNLLESKFFSKCMIRIEEKGDMLDQGTIFGHQKSNEWPVEISTR